jgi:rhamnosyltransferase
MDRRSAAGRTVCAVVVTYHPGPRATERLADVISQVDQLIVVDNGSAAPVAVSLRDWTRAAGATWIGNAGNLGSATALNQAARAAIDAGHGWLLTLDQDTTVPSDLVAELRAAIAADTQPDLVAVAAPTAVQQHDRRCRDRGVVRRRTAITSGSLVNLAAWQEVGGFRDDFFIDMVETDFCLRLGERGYRVVLACRARIAHRIGAPRRHRILGIDVVTSNHPAWRRYYMSRNRVHVWRAHWRHAPVWVLFDGTGQLRDTLVMALTEADRRSKLRATLRGLTDGLRGRTGRLVPPA